MTMVMVRSITRAHCRGQDVRRVRPHPPERRVEIAPAELPLAPDRRSFEALIEERGGNLEMPLLHDNDGPDSAARCSAREI